MAEVKSGTLSKEGGGLTKGWKSRWVILREAQLTTHKAQGDAAVQDSLKLDASSTVASVDHKKKKFCFEARSGKSTLRLAADSEKDEKAWVAAIQQEINKIKNPGKPNAASAASPAAANNNNNGSSNSAAGAGGSKKKMSADDFNIVKLIGYGSFGKVYIVNHKLDGREYAMKVLNKRAVIDRQEVENTRTERSILTKLRHPYLVSLYFSFQSEDKLYFVMDYIRGGEMFYHLQKDKKFSEDRARFYGAEITLGIAELHRHGIVYRDLKPENILITEEGHITLIDFGISKEGLKTEEDRTASFRGTPEYLAPEVLEGKLYGRQVDWWSFGTLLCEMLTGLPPFYSTDVQTMFKQIMSAKLELSDQLPPAAADLITKFLDRNPETRLQDINDIKAHPFFKAIDWDRLGKKELPPPWVPPPGYVDGETETPEDDPEEDEPDLSNITESMQQNFAGFTFTNPSGLEGGGGATL